MKAVFFDIDGTLIEGTHPDYRYMRENVQKRFVNCKSKVIMYLLLVVVHLLFLMKK